MFAIELYLQVSYNFKLRLSGRNGEVIYSHCECPAGKGPHGTCKHIACVLITLEKFTGGADIGISKTCTEILQSFHKPARKHEGK